MFIAVEKKYIKDNCYLKISMYLFIFFNESKDNYHITTILICLDLNPRFYLKDVNF